ncbi:TPA: hypothetical protein ACLBZV_005555 [Bacillus cereus]|uniref:hypothetical protein n=1 Tax=Bacillus cereus TaxID=1396 RepID=UPI001F427D4E|nr:hypothetical protein [Bacillus cereus]BCC15196.1 hypothetical protein BCM0074_p316 [Bacillus cereus]HDR6306417.1 hypothetical protein [Bacillus cereus]
MKKVGRPEVPEKKYRQKKIRFSKFEDFITTIVEEIDDEKSKNKIRDLFIAERDKVISRTVI